jgi:TonB family protein
MRSRIAVALLAFLPVLMFAPNHAPAQESSAGGRKIVSKVMPQYPGLARAMNLQGIVRAEVLVAPNGKVTSVEAKGGHPLLIDAAQSALREWKWEPASRETHEVVELRFKP